MQMCQPIYAAIFTALFMNCSADIHEDDLVYKCNENTDCNDNDPCTDDECSLSGECVHIDSSSAEVCDGKDNDCDGSIDEGCDCEPGEVKDCSTDPEGNPITWPGGSPIPPCHYGKMTCGANGKWGPCGEAIAPQPEKCDGMDNNCDGETDNGLTWEGIPLGSACSVGLGACQNTGTVACIGEEANCNAEEGQADLSGTCHESAASNGSWDWNCDGKITKCYPTSDLGLDEYCGYQKLKDDCYNGIHYDYYVWCTANGDCGDEIWHYHCYDTPGHPTAHNLDEEELSQTCY